MIRKPFLFLANFILLYQVRTYGREFKCYYRPYYEPGRAGHYSLSKGISIGTGLGAQFLFLSRSRVRYIGNSEDDLKFVNRYYKPIMPAIPLELSLKLKKVLFNIRYEYGLLNRFRGDLAKEQKDKYSLLLFEFEFLIK